MRRYFLIFLLTMLPLQLTWAAVASYCGHEQGKSVQHIGHHEHKHAGSAEVKAEQKAPTQVDLDCGYCHLSYAQAILSPYLFTVARQASAPAHFLSSFYRSPFPEARLKPDWLAAS